MLRPIACAAAALFTLSTAADAAIYRYDVTMGLTELSANLYTFGDGPADDVLPGMACEYDTDYNDHWCSGYADLRGKQAEIPYVEKYLPSVSAVFILDTMFDTYPTQVGHSPVCVGSDVLCRDTDVGMFDEFSRTFGSATADTTGFRISTSDGMSFVNTITESGLFFQNDASLEFRLGDHPYMSLMSDGITARYTTTSLNITEIAPVPLPAGTLLLPSALALLAWRRRRAA